VVLGTRDRSATLTMDELATVAVHEAGHALVAVLSPYADPVSRVTVLGAGQALGPTEHMQALHRLTRALVEREAITGDQVRALVRAASPAAASADRKISPNSLSS
jgi:ATP-dependent Zn protease